MPLSNVPTQVPLRHRGKGAACRSALVRLLPGVTLVVGVQGLLPRRSIRAARPRARVRLLPRVIAVVGVHVVLSGVGIAAAWPGALVRPLGLCRIMGVGLVG